MSRPGTAYEDTVCHICPNGTYSDIVSAQHNCMEHKSCDAAGLQLVLKGSIWHDSVCTSCEEHGGKKVTSFSHRKGERRKKHFLTSNSDLDTHAGSHVYIQKVKGTVSSIQMGKSASKEFWRECWRSITVVIYSPLIFSSKLHYCLVIMQLQTDSFQSCVQRSSDIQYLKVSCLPTVQLNLKKL